MSMSFIIIAVIVFFIIPVFVVMSQRNQINPLKDIVRVDGSEIYLENCSTDLEKIFYIKNHQKSIFLLIQ